MNQYKLNVIIAHSCKLLRRDILFKIFLFVSFFSILFFQLYCQSSFFGKSMAGMFSLDSFIPFMNFYLLVICQTITIIFLSVKLLNVLKEFDTVDVFYCRPESNMEYVWGISLSVIRTFLIVSVGLSCLSAIIQIFFSLTHVNVSLYIFYMLFFFLPSLVFTLGLVSFLFVWLRNRMLTIMLSILLLGGGVFGIGGEAYGVFDILAFKLPNTFSEITGFADVLGYVLQRACWLLVGFGFIQLAAILFDRIPNSSKHGRKVTMAIFLFSAGIFAGYFYYEINSNRSLERRYYTMLYDKYSEKEKVVMLKQAIKYEQKGEEMEVITDMLVQNQTGHLVDSITLFLNPALEIVWLECGSQKIPFKREGQVIRIPRKMKPNDTTRLFLNYRGKIDENICYLDIPQKIVEDRWTNSLLPFYFGKRYCFLHPDFTLLLPEVLWYPVTYPFINRESSYNVPKDCAYFTLKVCNQGNKTVISQGEKVQGNGYVLFNNTCKVPGISLCIGNYQTKTITVDSITYSLNLFKRHAPVFDWFTNIDSCFLANSLRTYLQDIEDRLGGEYFFKRLAVVETPISFASYFRNECDRTEFVQPELVFVREKGVGLQAGKRKLSSQIFTKFLDKYFFNYNLDDSGMFENMIYSLGRKNAINFAVYFYKEYDYGKYAAPNNPYRLSSLFLSNTYMESEEYPCMNMIINIARRGVKMEELNDYAYTRDALSYLSSESLQGALNDKELSSLVLFKILTLKSRQFINMVSAICNVPNDTIVSFIDDYMNCYQFDKCHFLHFNQMFTEHFQIELTDYLDAWYNQRGVPDLIVREHTVCPIRNLGKRGNGYPQYVRFKVYNNSDVDGVISVKSAEGNTASMFMISVDAVVSDPDFSFNRHYYVKARTGLEVAFVSTSGSRLAINTNLANNIPAMLSFSEDINDEFIDCSEYVRSIAPKDFYEREDEVIADNRDSSFRIVQSYWPKLKDRFSENNLNYPKYKSESVVVQPPKAWVEYISYDAYGEIVKSAVCCAAGNGNSRMEWHADIKKEGVYEVFVYIPNIVFIQNRKVSISNQNLGLEQEYLITCENGRECVLKKDIAALRGWISLGKYDYSFGRYRIALTNRGQANQTIVGDAVKWVYMGNK